MKTFLKKTRFLALALAMALAIQPLASVTTASDAHADSYTNGQMMVSAAVGSSSHPWFLGLLFVSVASIITCAMIVGSEEGRELTLDEAVHAGLVPLHCLLTLHLDDA
jgi:hypothetical protein